MIVIKKNTFLRKYYTIYLHIKNIAPIFAV